MMIQQNHNEDDVAPWADWELAAMQRKASEFERREEHERKKKEARKAFQKLSETSEGKIALAYIRDVLCEYKGVMFHPDARAEAFSLGRRSVWVSLENILDEKPKG